MAAAMVELTRQNQELTREISLRSQRHERHAEGQAQSQEDIGENAEPENQSKGTASRRVPHLEREIGLDDEGHGQDEGEHEKGESRR